MREKIVPTKSEIVSMESGIVLVKFRRVSMKFGSVLEQWRINYDLIDFN
jgi:hypothetical protein